MRALPREPRAAAVDGGVALVLAVLAQVELWADGPWTPFLAVIAVIGTAPLAFRRRFPLAVVLAVMTSVAALAARGTDYFTVAQLVAMMLAVYSVGAHAGLRRAAAGVAVAVGVGVGNSVLAADRPELGDVVFPAILLSVPWGAGRALRLWRRRTAELERLTEELAHEREERAALAVAAERARIARELHDVLTQAMNVIVLHAEGAEEALDHDPALARRPLRRIQDTGREALSETRRMLGVLHADEPLQPLPGTADLPALVDLVRSTGLDVRLRAEGAARPLPPVLELSVYRIVQQALTNTLAHAAARKVEIVLRYGADCLEVTVTDDGAGGVPGSGGHGIAGMRERAAVFGGSLTAGPGPSGGFVVAARLPIARVPA